VHLEIFSERENVDKLAHAMASLQRSMRWDEVVYGLEYDLDIYNIVAVNDFNMGAMENKVRDAGWGGGWVGGLLRKRSGSILSLCHCVAARSHASMHLSIHPSIHPIPSCLSVCHRLRQGLNVFNTAFVLAKPETATDTDYERIEGVIAHEYFHNWCVPSVLSPTP
jgi:hypothetical protein